MAADVTPPTPDEAGQEGGGDSGAVAGVTARLWTMSVEATFEADNVEDADAIASRLTERVLEHPSVWSAEGWFDPEQTTETVDV